jgi:hypothetical protein
MKRVVSPDIKRQVLELRRRSSIADVAKQTGLPLGTIKTICSRSGAFRDNMTHRALFTLPEMQPRSTAVAIPELPEPKTITGDFQLDAALCLRDVIRTGQPAAIEKAMEAFARITTPLKELGKRYESHLLRTSGGNPFSTFDAYQFDDLEGLAKRSVDEAKVRAEAESRFGNRLFHDTDAEVFCIGILDGLGQLEDEDDYSPLPAVIARFKSRPEVMPNTLSDCLHELHFWHQLWCLRRSHKVMQADGHPEANIRRRFIEALLTQIKPRSRAEAVAVLDHVSASDFPSLEDADTKRVIANLIR